MDVYTVDYAVRQGPLSDEFHTSLVITKLPLRWAAVDRLMQAVRYATGHRFCHLFGPIDGRISSHEEEFEVVVPEEVIDRYAMWRGWDLVAEDDIDWEQEPA